MWRSLWLAAAGCCLLGVFACAATAPANAHAPEPARRQKSSSERASGARTAAPQLTETKEDTESGRTESRLNVRGNDELFARYGAVRPLAVQRGSASYYGSQFSGRATASGASYDPRAYTAAHRSLPFGTVLRVTRLDGGGRVYVTVTDRGPYGPRGRILDLSHAAAERLGMLRAGVVAVQLEVVEYGPRRPHHRKR